MKCPICGKDVEIQKKQVDTDDNGNPIFNQYAICRVCKKQWNLDKQRAKKAAAKKEASETKPLMKVEIPDGDAPEKTPTAKGGAEDRQPGNRRQADTAPRHAADGESHSPKAAGGEAQKQRHGEHTKKSKPDGAKPQKKRPADEGSSQKRVSGTGDGSQKQPSGTEDRSQKRPSGTEDNTQKRPSGTEAQRKRDKGGEAQKKRPAGSDGQRHHSEGSAAQKRRREDEPAKRRPADKASGKEKPSREAEDQRHGNIPPQSVRSKRERAMKQGYQNMLSTDPDYNPAKNKSMAAKAKQQNRSVYEDNGQEDEDDEYEPMPKFQIVRIVFGVLSIIAFSYCAYHGFLAGLDNIASGSESSSGMTYIILALCMLVAGLLLLIMQRAETIFAFLLPMACYLGGGVYAFLNRGDISLLLYIAIACAVLTVLFLILAVISRFGSDGYDSADGYDDSYEDE